MSSASIARKAWMLSSLVLAAAVLGAMMVSAAGAAADGNSVEALDSATAFDDLNAAVSAMQTNYARSHPSDSSPAGIVRAVKDLTAKWISSGRRCPADYAQSIEDDAQQIMAAVVQSDASAASTILASVNDDLSKKEANAKANHR